VRSDNKAHILTSPLGPLSEEEKRCVRNALDEMAGSVPFRTSRQCQDLLRYIVLHSMEGQDESLRERIIGVDVFGRLPDYDQSEDPVVRIRAADVRKRIALYYESTDAVERRLKISIPSGSYRASFEFIGSGKQVGEHRLQENVISAPAESIPISPPIVISPSAVAIKAPRTWLTRTQMAAVGMVAVLLISIFYGLVQSTSNTPFERFWTPVLKNPNNSLIYVGSNAVYALSTSFVERYRQEHSLGKAETMGREILVPLGPNDVVAGKDLNPMRDIYVTVGDVAATARIASFLASRKKAYDMRFGGDISVGDLRERPAILIGAFNNSWTLEMTDNLRFFFAHGNQIQDRFDSRSWKADPGAIADPNFTEDYAIISRILNSKTGEILITAAGIGHAGTRAAGEFLTNPNAMNSVMLRAPKGWEKKNMQIVLHTTVINNSPGRADVIATYYW
jgi:hypothetical protein